MLSQKEVKRMETLRKVTLITGIGTLILGIVALIVGLSSNLPRVAVLLAATGAIFCGVVSLVGAAMAKRLMRAQQEQEEK